RLLEIKHPPRIVVFAGEVFPLSGLRSLRKGWPSSRMFNFYGPTETNVCTAYEVQHIPDDQTTPVPIGTAVCGDCVWVAREDGSEADPGEKGELWVEGPTVMQGYWGQERWTGPYRTGDLGIRRADGLIEFAGRRDQMLKVRGHRVEPGEIEAILVQHPLIREAAVLATGEGLEQKLVGVIVPTQAPPPTLIELKTFCAQHLPRYMLIDRLETRESLPRTSNGKIDRPALVRAVQRE
ncbi:MAG TPA: AMP-binding protein, partial [Planctomycetota bacterium]|nr:AMP-binding protein [Planctomycetota bacterium]